MTSVMIRIVAVAGVMIVPAVSAQAQKAWNPGIATPSAVQLHRERKQAQVSPLAAAVVAAGVGWQEAGHGGARLAKQGRRVRGTLDVSRTDASLVPPTMPHHPAAMRWTNTRPLDAATAAAAGLAMGLPGEHGPVPLRSVTTR